MTGSTKSQYLKIFPAHNDPTDERLKMVSLKKIPDKLQALSPEKVLVTYRGSDSALSRDVLHVEFDLTIDWKKNVSSDRYLVSDLATDYLENSKSNIGEDLVGILALGVSSDISLYLSLEIFREKG